MRITFNHLDLKITEDECLQVLDEENKSTDEFELGLSRDGNHRVMAVGYTKETKLCEVGIEFFEQNEVVFHIHVFHGMKATKTYQRLFSERKK